MLGAMTLKSSSNEQALPVLKHVWQAWQPPMCIIAASKRLTVCPHCSAASVKARTMAIVLPPLRGEPVTTVIFMATLFLYRIRILVVGLGHAAPPAIHLHHKQVVRKVYAAAPLLLQYAHYG